jgi:hypothetical protein
VVPLIPPGSFQRLYITESSLQQHKPPSFLPACILPILGSMAVSLLARQRATYGCFLGSKHPTPFGLYSAATQSLCLSKRGGYREKHEHARPPRFRKHKAGRATKHGPRRGNGKGPDEVAGATPPNGTSGGSEVESESFLKYFGPWTEDRGSATSPSDLAFMMNSIRNKANLEFKGNGKAGLDSAFDIGWEHPASGQEIKSQFGEGDVGPEEPEIVVPSKPANWDHVDWRRSSLREYPAPSPDYLTAKCQGREDNGAPIFRPRLSPKIELSSFETTWDIIVRKVLGAALEGRWESADLVINERRREDYLYGPTVEYAPQVHSRPFIDDDGQLRARYYPHTTSTPVIPGRWLRDMCACPECRNPDTAQRRFNVLSPTSEEQVQVSSVREIHEVCNCDLTESRRCSQLRISQQISQPMSQSMGPPGSQCTK